MGDSQHQGAEADNDAVGWVLYDGSCGLCARAVPWGASTLSKIGLRTAALQEPWVAARTGLSPDDLLTDITLLLPGPRLIRGAAAYRWVLLQRWWTWPLWLLATVPPTRWLFDLSYRTFARHRHRLSNACSLPPPG